MAFFRLMLDSCSHLRVLALRVKSQISLHKHVGLEVTARVTHGWEQYILHLRQIVTQADY